MTRSGSPDSNLMRSLAMLHSGYAVAGDCGIGPLYAQEAAFEPLRFRRTFAIVVEADLQSARVPTMATLTKRQKQLVDYLENYINEHGYAPTLSEVGQYFGLSSLATVHKHLHNLESKGIIKRQHNHSRALEVAASEKHEAARALRLLGTV